jgi:hypothetical protein
MINLEKMIKEAMIRQAAWMSRPRTVKELSEQGIEFSPEEYGIYENWVKYRRDPEMPYIQDLFPNLSPDQRGYLLDGITIEERKAMEASL